MTTTTGHETMLAMLEAELETVRPETLPHEEAPRTHADIVRGMLPVDFSAKRAQQERARLAEAIQFMREADAKRVLNWTDLRSPFSGLPLAA